MSALLLPARTLVDPVEGVPTAVSSARWVWPLVLLALATALSGLAFAVRWDAAPSVVKDLQASGELGRMTEQEVLQAIEVKGRTALVAGVAKGVFLMPLLVLLTAVALKLASWLLGTPGTFKRLFTAAAVAYLPVALFHLLFAVCALRQDSLSLEQSSTLLASHLGAWVQGTPKLKGALAAVDFFSLWGVALLGLGFAEATGMRKGRAMLSSVVLYAMYVGVFLVGLPGMQGGQP